MNLVKKYNELSRPIKASFWFIISNIIIRGMSFITLPIFSRLLTTSEYGTVSVYQSWVSIVSIITTLTIWGGVFNVGMVKFENRQKEMMSAFQGLAMTITLLFMGISIFALPIVTKLTRMTSLLVVVMFVDILAQIPFNIWSTEQRYQYKYKKLVIVTLLISIANPILGFIAVTNFVNNKPEARIISGLIVQLIVGIVLFFSIQNKGKKYFSQELWKYGFLFNVVLIPHYLSTQILNQSDRLMINNMCGSSDAGIYSIAYSFAMLLSLITSGVNSSLTPFIYQRMKDNDMAKLKGQISAVLWGMAFITMAFIAFIPDVFMLLLPESYYPALKVIPPVTLGAFFLFLYPLFGSIEFYFEENKYVTIASIGGALLNIGLNSIFIPLFGYIAAAYTTFFCYLCYTVFHYAFMKIVCRKHNYEKEIYDVKSIVLISITLSLFGILMNIIYDNILIRWGIILCILITIYVQRKKLIWIIDVFKKSKNNK